VADHEQGNSQESLTKREQEVIQILASQIVREAGIHPTPEREANLEERRLKVEAKLERRKMQAEATKTQVLISSGLLVGLAAVLRLLPQAALTWPLFLAFLSVLTSVISGIWEMRAIA
jgi:hypothetical protein